MARSRSEREKAFTPEESIVFNLVDEATVDRLRKLGDVDLPSKKIDISKDEKWNMKLLNSKLLQGILKGDDVLTIADSIMDVVGNNKASAIRNARTMTTGAENSGRLDSYKNLANQGVVQKKVWIATPDDRTRESHAVLDGEEVDIDKEFSNGLMKPGDRDGDPSEVYNCRCTMRDHIIGFRRKDGSISYVEGERDKTMHSDQMVEEKERRGNTSDENESKGVVEVKSINPEDFKDSDTKNGSYAYELAEVANPRYDEEHLFVLNKNGNKAFANTWEDDKTLEIEFMGSTGGGVGTEIFIAMAERAADQGLEFTWLADHKSAINYYSHLGLDKYIEKKYSDNRQKRYTVSVSQLDELLKKLRKR